MNFLYAVCLECFISFCSWFESSLPFLIFNLGEKITATLNSEKIFHCSK